jgi:hypothetical protein
MDGWIFCVFSSSGSSLSLVVFSPLLRKAGSGWHNLAVDLGEKRENVVLERKKGDRVWSKLV